jgi:hypothetical protein
MLFFRMIFLNVFPGQGILLNLKKPAIIKICVDKTCLKPDEIKNFEFPVRYGQALKKPPIRRLLKIFSEKERCAILRLRGSQPKPSPWHQGEPPHNGNPLH